MLVLLFLPQVMGYEVFPCDYFNNSYDCTDTLDVYDSNKSVDFLGSLLNVDYHTIILISIFKIYLY